MKKIFLCLLTFFALSIQFSVPANANSERLSVYTGDLGFEDEQYDYDALGRVIAVTASYDGEPCYLTTYDYYDNGVVRTRRETTIPCEAGSFTVESHYDPHGHCMDIVHFLPWWDVILGMRLDGTLEAKYNYDSQKRLVKLEAEVAWFDLPEEHSHVVFLYQYDKEGRVNTVKSEETYSTYDFSNELQEAKEITITDTQTTSFFYNSDGSYTTIDKIQSIGGSNTTTQIIWVCRFDNNGALFYERPYRSDGKNSYVVYYGDDYDLPDKDRYSNHTPRASDLDMIEADIRYPRKQSFYLDDYKYAAVIAKTALVFVDPNPSNIMAADNTFRVKAGEEVVVLAESQKYACVIFPELNRAGWISLDDLSCD